ncbi:hypothetical protein AFCA_008063 [Aspergillus flavus]|nr:hypothetical protein AFCA_008063 [Aspergillus flavus]
MVDKEKNEKEKEKAKKKEKEMQEEYEIERLSLTGLQAHALYHLFGKTNCFGTGISTSTPAAFNMKA